MKYYRPIKFKIKKFSDTRGFLGELHSKKIINLNFNHSIISSSRKNVIRGLHFRTKPEYKILYIVKGKIKDFCLDLKKKKINKFLLKENDCLLIPPGYAHGYECLDKENIIIYFLSWAYNPNLQSGIFWKDKDLNIKWSIKKPIISKKDKNLPSYKRILKNKFY